MQTRVMTLKGILYDGDVTACNVKTTSGEITVLDNHLPLVTVLDAGNLKLETSEGKKTSIPIKSGFLEVSAGNTLSILARV